MSRPCFRSKIAGAHPKGLRADPLVVENEVISYGWLEIDRTEATGKVRKQDSDRHWSGPGSVVLPQFPCLYGQAPSFCDD